MLFSIVIPVYNSEKYLRNLLEKLVKICESGIAEIILINDGSKDSSGVICDEFASNYSYVKVYHQMNRGAAAARYKGIIEAKGEYVLFIDSDDDISEDILNRLSQVIAEHDVDFIVFGCSEVDKKGRVTCSTFSKLKGYVSSQELKEKFCFYAKSNELNSMCNKVFKREIIQENKIFFPNVKYGEDAIFVCEYLSVLDRGSYIMDDVLYYYIPREGSVTRTYYENRFWDEMKLINKLEKCAEEFKSDFAEKKELLTIKYYNALMYEIYNVVARDCKLSFVKKCSRIRNIMRIEEINHSLRNIKNYIQFDFKKYIQWLLLRSRMHAVLILLLQKNN